jgi:hypothetical protein
VKQARDTHHRSFWIKILNFPERMAARRTGPDDRPSGRTPPGAVRIRSGQSASVTGKGAVNVR